MFTPAHLWVTFCENFSELVWNKICIYESCKTTGRRRPKKISGYFLCKCPWSIPESIQGIVFFGGVFIDHCFQHCTIVKANLIHQFRYPLHDLQCYSVHRQFAILKVHLSWTKIAPSHLPCSTRKYEASNIWLFRYYLHTCLSTFKYISSKFLKRSEEIKHQYLFNLKFKLSSTFMFAPLLTSKWTILPKQTKPPTIRQWMDYSDTGTHSTAPKLALFIPPLSLPYTNFTLLRWHNDNCSGDLRPKICPR